VNPNKALWEKGDFTHIADSMRVSGEALVQKLGITKGLKVLDLGCGDGTTALPRARLGADVLGVDIARNLVEAGNKRAKEQGLGNCRFQEGGATNLHQLEDHTFDLVVSIFGAMFAPKPFDVAKEMVRVTRPGGRIVMGNWIPNDPTLVAQILKISSSYAPPPPEGFISPMTWGIESNVIERFCRRGGCKREDIVRQRHLHLQISRSAIKARRCIQRILRADHERIRGRGEERANWRFAEGAGRSVHEPKPKPKQGFHIDSGHLPARYCCTALVIRELSALKMIGQ
jgi:ubiquinone/menaquinone biosynthesis C-methylase UbiE